MQNIHYSADYFQVSPRGTSHHSSTLKVFSLTNDFKSIHVSFCGKFTLKVGSGGWTLINFLVQCDLMNNTCRSHSDLLSSVPSVAQAEDMERFTGTDYIYLGGHKLCWIYIFVKL